ncbi:unnamed protein product [Brassicogethes aeneus]|uniref:Cytochrome P450 n=1 Tax=Brassicogethes aeneus TaxID=1431903 RepID=A0A9P0AVF0_BRAAE|nr:unnamed protein product [Brassicogethes aeneus]
MIFFVSPLSIVLLSVFIVAVLIIFCKKLRNVNKLPVDGLQKPPTPFKFPIIGHMHLLAGYSVPYEAFSNLGRKYGNVVKLQLGNVKCVVVNGQKNIREALITKGHHFDSRPNFERYQMLFGGNKENSLAFCDWSDTQKLRRDMLKVHTFPRSFTNTYYSLDNLIQQASTLIKSEITPNKSMEIKPIILKNCANIFTAHFCSKTFSVSDEKFIRMVENFDDIFYEVNQGYAADFLPFLMPFHKKNLERINSLTHEIREFILDEVVGSKFNVDTDVEGDYLDSLIKRVKTNSDLTWETALFALEDIIGGHSAVGNFLIKLLAYLAKESEVQAKIQAEIDAKEKPVTICDRSSMPYTEATIFEAVRLIASPIVPRVANQNSSINGYEIEKDTVLFLNNYDLSMSKALWNDPAKFKPERFLKNGKIVKPDYFLPFGGGRRSCMGYKIVQLVSFGILSDILQNYTVLPDDGTSYEVPVGSLALPKNTFKFKFISR